MCMNGHEVKVCCECNASDYESFMVERDGEWFCKEDDPGPTPAPDRVDYAMSREDR